MSVASGLMISFRSPPPQKALPAPVRIITRTPDWASMRSSTRPKSAEKSRPMALTRSGQFKVTVAIPSLISRVNSRLGMAAPSMFSSKTDEFATEDFPRNDDALDVAGTFADLIHLGVAKIALDGKIAQITITAENLDRVVAGAQRGFDREVLGHAGLEFDRHAGVVHASGIEREQARGLHLGCHLRQRQLYRLEGGYRLAELRALARVGECRIERRLPQADGERGDVDAAAVQGSGDGAKTRAFIADEVFGWNRDKIGRASCRERG